MHNACPFLNYCATSYYIYVCVCAYVPRDAPSGTIFGTCSNVARNVGICTVNFKSSFRCSKTCRHTLLQGRICRPRGCRCIGIAIMLRRYNFRHYCNVPHSAIRLASTWCSREEARFVDVK